MAKKNKIRVYTRIEYISMLNTLNTTFFNTKNFKMSTCVFFFRGGEIVVQEKNFSQLKKLGGSVCLSEVPVVFISGSLYCRLTVKYLIF